MRCLLAVFLGLLLTAATPAANPFYNPPSPLPAGKPGEVIRSQLLVGGSALPSAARNLLVLYHTTSANGADVAVSGTIAVPRGKPPGGGWPVVSWAHGTTGNGPLCAPSLFSHPDGEQRMLDAWVARGYVVVQTDYEGQGVPGLHPYYIETAAAHDVTDIVRAARHLDPDIGTRWIALGHSEGGAAALATAELGNAWAPDIHLLGAISYAPGSHITLFLQDVLNGQQAFSELSLFGEMIESYAANDPKVHLSDILTPSAIAMLPLLQQHCESYFETHAPWSTQIPAQMFLAHPDLPPLVHDFITNEPSVMHISLPVLLLQGTSDHVVGPQLTQALDRELCRNGAPVTFDVFTGKNHFTLLPAAQDTAMRWADAIFAGTPPPTNCGSQPNVF